MIFGLFDKKPFRKGKLMVADNHDVKSSILREGGTTKTIFIPKLPPEILGDESGDWGNEEGSSDYYATTVVLTDNPEYFRYVGGKYKANTRPDKNGKVGDPNGELKFRTSSDEVRVAVLEDIMKSEPKIYSVVRLKDITKLSGIELYKQNYKDVLELVAKDTSGNIMVEIDDHNSLKMIDFSDICDEKSKGGTKFKTDIKRKGVDSKKDRRFQAIDFPVGAIGHCYKKKLKNDEKEKFFKIIESRTIVDVKNDNKKRKVVRVRKPDQHKSCSSRFMSYNSKSNGKYKKLMARRAVR